MEFKIDESKVIHTEPIYRVWGVVVENKKHGKRLILGGKIATICGIIGFIGLISLFSYVWF